MDVFRIYGSDDFSNLYSFIKFKIKNMKLKIKKILIEKYKNMKQNLDFQQNYYSIKTYCIYAIGHDSN